MKNVPVAAFVSPLHGLLTVVASLLVTGSLPATDVAFWNEYRPDKDAAEQTYLLLQFKAEPLAAVGPIRAVESVGQPGLVNDGRFGAGLRLDGRTAVRCVPSEVFAGGLVSMEAWIKLDRYPEQEGCAIFRPALVDVDARYDPQRDRSQGFSLLVDNRGGLHLETVNTFYGKRVRTSSEPGAVPLNRWVHVAGICGPARRLFVDGRPVADLPIHWGEGLEVAGDVEQEPQPVDVGNNDQGSAGLVGSIDQVRVHRNGPTLMDEYLTRANHWYGFSWARRCGVRNAQRTQLARKRRQKKPRAQAVGRLRPGRLGSTIPSGFRVPLRWSMRSCFVDEQAPL